jgi:hypothetical protein
MVESILDDLLHYQYIELLAIYADSTNVPEEEQYAETSTRRPSLVTLTNPRSVAATRIVQRSPLIQRL